MPSLGVASKNFWATATLFLSLCVHLATSAQWVTYTNNDGQTVYLDDDRQPALYTKDYGDCLGDSAISVTRFDAAYYKDNMTITFHIGGSTTIANASLMMYLGVYAYGESRFSQIFDPCAANINSLCPLNHSVPIEVNGVIPLAPAQAAGIPTLALTIPDFEGQAILRLFANATESEIACYAAALTNGNSFSHPAAVGSTVGVFVASALISSVAVAAYGESIRETRNHYAHSVSVFVVFSVLQHIYFSSALSLNFPSVLPNWSSNFAWASGLIYSRQMQDSINKFVSSNRNSNSKFGSPVSGQNDIGLGGGYDISSIYRRAAPENIDVLNGPGGLQPTISELALHKRDLINSTSGFKWYGSPVRPGIPLPGNYSGFAGTLDITNIPPANAFMTGLLWFLISLAIFVAVMILSKVLIEILVSAKLVRVSRLNFVRTHWIYFIGIFVFRTCYVAFFTMICLALFQFAFGGDAAVNAIAAITFLMFFLGLLSVSSYALWQKLNGQKFSVHRVQTHDNSKPGDIPENSDSQETLTEEKTISTTTTFSIFYRRFQLRTTDPRNRQHPHDDDDYMINFGWLWARFRRSRWWFFSFWLLYEFVRACFYGGAAANPLAQVSGLLVWEAIAFAAIVILRPFESSRLNILLIYLLGISKIVCLALSLAFYPGFNVNRIVTTALGIVMVVIQGILLICLLLAIATGVISSWMSIRRFHEDFHPKSLVPARIRYFAHIDQTATDQPTPPKLPKQKASTEDTGAVDEFKAPHFSITAVRRETKIEDDDLDDEKVVDPEYAPRHSIEAIAQTRSPAPSQRLSIGSRSSISNLPPGARRHRASWSMNDVQYAGHPSEPLASRPPSRTPSNTSRDNFHDVSPRGRKRSSSKRSTADPVPMANAANQVSGEEAQAHQCQDNISSPNASREGSLSAQRGQTDAPTRPKMHRLDTIDSNYDG